MLLLHRPPPPTEARALRARLASGELLRFPGAFNPLSRAAHRGQGLRRRLHLGRRALRRPRPARHRPDDAHRGRRPRRRQIARMTDLPALVDADTGFGEPMNVARTVQVLEDAGLAGLPHRGPGQPEALRPPRRQERRRRRHRAQAHPRRRRRPPRPELPDHGAHRHPRRRRPARPRSTGPRRSSTPAPTRSSPRRWRDLERVRGDARRGRRADARQHDRVRQERAVHRASSSPTSASTSSSTRSRCCASRWAPPSAGSRRSGRGHAGRRSARRDAAPARELYELLDYEAYNHFDTASSTSRLCAQPVRIDRMQRDPDADDDEDSMTAGHQEGPRRRRRRHHGGLEGQPRDQLAALPRLPRAGARRALHRSRRSPTCCGTASCPTPEQLAEFAAPRARAAAPSTPTSSSVIDALPLDRAPDGRGAHRGQRARRAATRLADGLHARRPTCAKSIRLFAAAAGDRRLRPAPPPRARTLVEPRDDLGYSANFLWMTFGEEPEPRRRRRVRRLDDPVRRALLQRLDLHGPRDHLDARPTCYSAVVGGDRRAQGPAARRRQRGRHAHLRRDRHRPTNVERRWLDDGARREAQDHGLRAPRLQARRLARADDEGRARHARSRTTTGRTCSRLYDALETAMVERKGIKPEPRLPRRARLPPDRLRHPDLHAAVRRQPHHRLDRAHHGAARHRTR